MKKKVVLSLISVFIIVLLILASVGLYLNNKDITEIAKVEDNKNLEIRAEEESNLDVVGTWDVSKNQDGSVIAVLYSNGKMVISGTGDMKNYSNSSDREYDSVRESIVSVEIKQGVTSIGIYAFDGCSSLTSVEIPNSVTNIGYVAFGDCESLTSIEIQQGVTSIGARAFENCRSLTSIKIPDNVTNIGQWTFLGCSSLTSIEIPNSVISIGYEAFSFCKSLTSIEIPANVTSIGARAFGYCESLTSIEIPNSVISIGDNAFWGCSSLTSINVNEDNIKYSSENGILFNKDKTEIMCYPAGKKDTITYTIPNSVVSIGNKAFSGCDFLARIIVLENVVNIGNNAFNRCDSLTIYCKSDTEIEKYAKNNNIKYVVDEIEKIDENIVSSYDVSKNQDGSVTAVLYSNGKMVISGTGDMNSFPDSIKSSIMSVEIQQGVTSIGSYAFYGCSSLTSIEIPNSVTSIGSYAFYGCSSSTIYCKSNTKAEEYAKNNSMKYVIDDEAPTVNIIGNTTEWTNKDITLTINATDNLVGLESLPYSFDGGTTWQKENTKTYNEYVEKLNIQVRDAVGNITTNEICTKIDKTAPTITSVTGNPTEWTNKDVTLTVNASDKLSGLATQAYSFDNGTTWQKENTKTYSDNTNGIVIKVKDNLGNIATLDAINITKIDKTAPTITSVTGNPTTSTKENVTLTINASDNLSGLAEQAYSFDNGTTWQKENTKTYSENTNGIIIKVKDSVGNIATYSTINITKIISPTSIEIKTNPTKTTYYQGEELDITGLELLLNYDDNSSKEVNSGFTVTPTQLNEVGTQKIIVTYAGKTASFNVTVLKIIDTSVYTVEDSTIKSVKTKTTLSEFKKNVTIGGTTKILSKNGTELKDTDIITTGTKIQTTISDKTTTYTIAITGDTNGDGQADLKDILAINKHRLNKTQLKEEYLTAGDVNGDGKVDLRDLLQINKYRLGKINSL